MHQQRQTLLALRQHCVPGGRFVLLLAIVMLPLLAGCEQIEAFLSSQVVQREPVIQDPVVQIEGERTIDLNVLEGPAGGTLAFAQVYIDDHGPYNFALDTGASHTVVDQSILDELGLEPVGRTGAITGITGNTQANAFRLESWRVGDVNLPPTLVVGLNLPDGAAQSGDPQTKGAAPAFDIELQGLLGSDILSGFGSITIDYDRQVLIVRPNE